MIPAALALAALFVLVIPVNIYVAVRVVSEAMRPPRLPLLVTLAYLVAVLAALATVLGVLSANSVLFLFTGLRIIPTPFPTFALVIALIVASLANVFVWLYLRWKPR